MIQQVIVVEGKSDIARVRQAVDADLIATGGYALRSAVIQDIRVAYEKRGIIILTDPDGPGEKIRSRLSVMFPEALHAFVPKSEASTEDDVGIEDASPESIRKALDKVRILYQESSHEFHMEFRPYGCGRCHGEKSICWGYTWHRIWECQAVFAQAESFWDYTKGVGIRVGGVREKV